MAFPRPQKQRQIGGELVHIAITTHTRKQGLLRKMLTDRRQKSGQDAGLPGESKYGGRPERPENCGDGVVRHLSQLENHVATLSLTAQFTSYREAYEVSLPSDLSSEVRQCVALATLLVKHDPALTLFRTLLSRYEQLHKYVRARATLSLRKSLRRINYPATDGCNTLSDELSSWVCVGWKAENERQETFAEAAVALVKLQLMHDKLLNYTGHNGQRGLNHRLDLIDELCRPIVNRARFHFLDEGILDNEKNKKKRDKSLSAECVRTTSSRLDCLPQWLFSYLTNVISEGPYDLIKEDLQPMIHDLIQKLPNEMPADEDCSDLANTIPIFHSYEACHAYFLTEMVKLGQNILQTRNFFRHPMILDINANPVHLSNAIEQLLLFDSFISCLFAASCNKSQNMVQEKGLAKLAVKKEPPRLIDIFLGLNDILMQWWISLEKDHIFSLLSAASSSEVVEDHLPVSGITDNSSAVKIPLSSVAETFIALLGSARSKANAIGIPDRRREYVSKLIVPLCTRFMDLMHEEASMMRNLLVQRKNGSSPPHDDNLRKNFFCWIEIITGTHIASIALLNDSRNVVILGTDEDLVRVGRSFERLRDAMVDEFGSSFIETILCERAKLVGYLMRCPHMLSSSSANQTAALSPDLNEAVHVLSVVLNVCDAVLRGVHNVFEAAIYRGHKSVAETVGRNYMHKCNAFGFASKAIKSNLAQRLNEKFLEVALDVHEMIPEVRCGGAEQFYFDINVIVGMFFSDQNRELISHSVEAATDNTFSRLIHASTLMTMDFAKLSLLREAIHDLTKSNDAASQAEDCFDEPLTYDTFEVDGTLHEEAKSMLNAKGLLFLEVEDSISILNRRIQ